MTTLAETLNSSPPPARVAIPLSARATAARLRISVSPARSVRPIAMVVKERDGTAWRVITVTVAGSARWYGDPPYPACPGNRWIDLEVECPHDHPPTEAAPIELCGVVACEVSALPVCATDTEQDRQWERGSRRPRGARKLSNDEWEETFRGDSAPVHPIDPQDSVFITEVRCRSCDGVLQRNGDHADDCSKNCSGTFAHTQPLMRPCDFAARACGHGSVVYVPRLVPRNQSRCP